MLIPPCSLFFFFYCSAPHRVLHSFPTRRSSDLREGHRSRHAARARIPRGCQRPAARRRPQCRLVPADRKSTRLNSSHVSISYAVFCLKKKKNKNKKDFIKRKKTQTDKHKSALEI